jgi:hypothetical protein
MMIDTRLLPPSEMPAEIINKTKEDVENDCLIEAQKLGTL